MCNKLSYFYQYLEHLATRYKSCHEITHVSNLVNESYCRVGPVSYVDTLSPDYTSIHISQTM